MLLDGFELIVLQVWAFGIVRYKFNNIFLLIGLPGHGLKSTAIRRGPRLMWEHWAKRDKIRPRKVAAGGVWKGGWAACQKSSLRDLHS